MVELINELREEFDYIPVSYTHLDVYKRQDKKTSDAGQHQYTGTWAWEPVKDDNGNVTGYTASVTGVKCRCV